MAERRMFAKTIIDSDAFLDMPLTTQALYFHLSMRADDEGFTNNPKRIMRLIGASEDELKILIAKKFIISFDSGIVVIKHWRMHNYIQKDRFKATGYTFERSLLSLKDNNVYTMDTECIQDVPVGKVRLGEDRLVKDSLGDITILSETESQAITVADYLVKNIIDNKPNFKGSNISAWSKDIEKAIRIDKRTVPQLIGCIDWIYNNPKGAFWIPNILSGKKLREKFDTMESQMMQSNNKNEQTMKNLKIAEDIYNAK